MYDKKILIAVSAAAVVGLLGLAPQAYANNVDQQERAAGDSPPGNPLPWWWNASDSGRGSFAYQPLGDSFAYQPLERVKHNKRKKQ